MKLISLLVLWLSVTGHAAISITLTQSPNSGPVFVLETTTLGLVPVPDGALVRIGTFEVQPQPVNVGGVSSFYQLEPLFQEFGTTQMGHAGAPNTGRIQKTGILGSPTGQPDSYFIGKKLYIWVTSLTSEYGGIYNGIFSSSNASVVFSDTSFSVPIARFDQAYGGEFVLWQSSASASQLKLAAFPEPSSVVLMLATSLFSLAPRRRK